MEQKQFNKNESWNKFINNQKDNKTYLVGHYKPILPLNKENQEINNNNLFEELEKDKYYYMTMNQIIYIIMKIPEELHMILYFLKLIVILLIK